MKNEKSLELCTKCGTCLSVCPSYKVFLSEAYSPRGRNFLLSQKRNHPSFNFCLFCERCKEVCPHNLSFPEFYFRSPDLKTYLLAKSLSKVLDLWLEKKKFLKSFSQKGDLLLYPSCGMFFFYSLALTKFLKFAKEKKISFGIPKNLTCCGAPFLSWNLKEEVIKRALLNLQIFEQTSQPILMFCATCLWIFQKVYPLLFENTKYYERFLKLAQRIKSAYFFLSSEFKKIETSFPKEKTIFHLPCHLTEEFNLVNTKLEVKNFCCGSAKGFLWLEGFQERYKKFWVENLSSSLMLATFCTGCYLTFKFLIKEPPKIGHWLEVLL